MIIGKKKKIVLCYNFILHYRTHLFNDLCSSYDLTIIHSGKSIRQENDLYTEVITAVKKHGPFYIQYDLKKEIQKLEFDYIIFLFDLRWLNSLRLILELPKDKVILWGAWFTNNRIANFFRIMFSKMAYSNIFYSQRARKKFIEKGVSPEKCFVANNTVYVPEISTSKSKENPNFIISVGSLNKRKGHDELIQTFHEITGFIPKDIKLLFIGNGPEKENLLGLVDHYALNERIIFIEKIENPLELAEYYRKSIFSISLNQAGLSILQSLGFGVPFITKRNAISGGEISNIINGYNGILVDDEEFELHEIIKKLINNTEFREKLSRNALEHYKTYCTINNMVQGFKDAIERTYKTKIYYE